MKRAMEILNASFLWRCVDAFCAWMGRQWERSALVHWFLHPAPWGQAASEHSIFFKSWELIRGGLCKLFALLRLDKLFAGSVFGQTWLWCLIPVALAPIVPTMLVLALAAVGYCAVALALVRDRERRLLYAPVNRYILLYAAIYLVGTFVSVDFRGSIQAGLLRVAFVLFAIVLMNAITNRKQMDTLLLLVVVSATLVAAYGVCQYVFGWGYQDAAWVDSDMFSAISFRVPSTLENPNMLGQFLILMIPLGGAGLLSAKTWGKRVFYFVCCAVMCVCMILTYSRGAWLGLLFAGAAFFVLLNPRLMLLAPFALVALYFVLPETVISRFTSIGNMGDNSTSYRVYIWMGTLAMLKDYWLCGVGPGESAFNMVYPAYGYNGIEAPHAHNLLLQIVCDAGIVELVIFLVLLVVHVRMLCVAISREKDWGSRVHQIALLSGVAGFMVQAMTDYSFYNYRVMFIFWAYLALGVLACRRSQMPEGRLFE